MIYTTNWIEMIKQNYKKDFKNEKLPSPESVLFLLGCFNGDQNIEISI